MDVTPSFGQWLKRRRKDLLLTQEALAKLVGCAAITIRKIEANELRPSQQIAEQLAQHLELEAHERATFTTFARTGRRPAPPPTADASGRSPQNQRRTNLPVQRERLIGREQEVVTIRDLLLQEQVGLVTMTGPGGVGKTRLALQVAVELLDQFADGIWFIDLAPVADPTLVVPTIATTLGVKDLPGQALLDSLAAYLRPKMHLLVLDNFEQVVAAAPRVADLLRAAPHLKVLVTSRVVLHLSGEQEYPVPPLALPDPTQPSSVEQLSQYAAVALFIQRAQAAKPDFQVTAKNAQAIVELCVRLDGLPLAIELATARVKLFAPATLLLRLAEPLKMLTGGARDLPQRHQTLRATLDWSYDLLAREEQAVFRRLGVFVGGWTFAAAEAVCSVQGDRQSAVTDGLQALLDQSLIQSVEQPSGEPRFRMLETMREYALEHLEKSGESDLLRQQYVAYYVQLAEKAEPELEGHEQQPWLQRLAADYDNIRAVVAWSCTTPATTELGLRVVTALGGFWWRRGAQREARTWLERLLEQGGGSVAARARALLTLAGMVSVMDEYALATRLYDESLACFRELDDRLGIARTLLDQGRNLRLLGDYGRATPLEEESLTYFQSLQDRSGVANALMSLGDIALDQGELEQAQLRFGEAKALSLELGNIDGAAWATLNLGCAAYAAGDKVQARRLLMESLAQFSEVDNRSGLPMVLQALGYVAHAQGEIERAAALFRESIPLAVETGSPQMLADSFAGLVGVAAIAWQPERAARLCGAVAALLLAPKISLSPIARAGYERDVGVARSQLDEATFAAAEAEGQAMTLEQAVAYALEEAPDG